LCVVDGARSRWSNLLFLDAVFYLLEFNQFQSASRRAFNQQQVLYNCIRNELQRAHPALYAAHVNRDGKQNEEKIRVAIHDLRSPWTSAVMLKKHLLSDPTAKSRTKFLSILEYLFGHEVVKRNGNDLRITFSKLVEKVVYGFTGDSTSSRSSGSRTSSPSYNAQSELSSNDTASSSLAASDSLLTADVQAKPSRNPPRLRRTTRRSAAAVPPQLIVALSAPTTAAPNTYHAPGPANTSPALKAPANAAVASASSAFAFYPREGPVDEIPLQAVDLPSNPSDGHFDLRVFDGPLDPEEDTQPWEYLDDWAWGGSPRFLTAPLEHPILLDRPAHPLPDSDPRDAHRKLVSVACYPTGQVINVAHSAPQRTVLSTAVCQESFLHTAVPFPDNSAGSLYARRSAFAPTTIQAACSATIVEHAASVGAGTMITVSGQNNDESAVRDVPVTGEGLLSTTVIFVGAEQDEPQAKRARVAYGEPRLL
jgi:hypothetical protein